MRIRKWHDVVESGEDPDGWEDRLAERFEEAGSLLDAELDESIESDGVDRGFQ